MFLRRTATAFEFCTGLPGKQAWAQVGDSPHRAIHVRSNRPPHHPASSRSFLPQTHHNRSPQRRVSIAGRYRWNAVGLNAWFDVRIKSRQKAAPNQLILEVARFAIQRSVYVRYSRLLYLSGRFGSTWVD